METSLISDFAILSIVMGLLIGLGTMSKIRGLFTFLIFMGLTLAQVLGVLGVNEILSYFLGLAIIMGSTCLLLSQICSHGQTALGDELLGIGAEQSSADSLL